MNQKIPVTGQIKALSRLVFQSPTFNLEQTNLYGKNRVNIRDNIP